MEAVATRYVVKRMDPDDLCEVEYYAPRVLFGWSGYQRRAQRFTCRDCAHWAAEAMGGRVVRLLRKGEKGR